MVGETFVDGPQIHSFRADVIGGRLKWKDDFMDAFFELILSVILNTKLVFEESQRSFAVNNVFSQT